MNFKKILFGILDEDTKCNVYIVVQPQNHIIEFCKQKERILVGDLVEPTIEARKLGGPVTRLLEKSTFNEVEKIKGNLAYVKIHKIGATEAIDVAWLKKIGFTKENATNIAFSIF